MAIGRIGTTPTLRTRWSKQPSGGTTSLSGLDDNSVSLVYDVGYEAVYRNGVLLSRGNDYTATSGTSITLIDATIAGDVIEVFANQSIPLTDTYTQTVADGKFINNTIVDAKGDIIAATAADTVSRLAVGANDTVLTADSSTATGLKWAVPAAGGMTSLATGSLSGTTTTISSIPSTYVHLYLVIEAPVVNVTTPLKIIYNGVTTSTYVYSRLPLGDTTVAASGGTTGYQITNANIPTVSNTRIYNMQFFDYSKALLKNVVGYFSQADLGNVMWGNNTSNSSAISSIGITTNNGTSTFSGGTYTLYGVK